jgi:hypothetical protein
VIEKMAESEELQAVLGEILRTLTPIQARILEHLFSVRQHKDGENAKHLIEKVFQRNLGFLDDLNSPMAVGGRDYSEETVRQHCTALRKALDKYTNSHEAQRQRWHFTLPPGSKEEGYRLRIVDKTRAPGTAGAFWQSHLSPARDIFVVCNEPLFFRDYRTELVLRYLDVNQDESHPEQAIAELQKLHHDEHTPEMHPSQLYLLSGEVAARDYIQEWFLNHGVKVRMAISRNTDQKTIAGSSPILLGNPRINRHMRRILEIDEPHFRYRTHPKTAGLIEIENPTDDERPILREHNVRADDGHWYLRDDSTKRVFCVISRIPNPWEDGVVTMIACEWSRATEEIARMLTSEERMNQSFKQPKAPKDADERLPQYFQAIFAIRLDPVNRDGRAHKPQLLLSHFDSAHQR